MDTSSSTTTPIEAQISAVRNSLQQCTNPQTSVSEALSLIERLELQYETSQNTSYLDDMISIARETLQATSSMSMDAKTRAELFEALSFGLNCRYKQTKEARDLDESIDSAQKAIQLAEFHPDMADWLNSLGNYLEMRYRRVYKPEDLNESIARLEQAVHIAPQDHPNRRLFLTNLGFKLESRFRDQHQAEDIAKSIDLARQTILSVSKHQDQLPHFSHILQKRLALRYMCSGKNEDFEEALENTPSVFQNSGAHENDYKVELLNHRAGLLTKSEKLSDVEECIRLTGHALQLCTDTTSSTITSTTTTAMLQNLSAGLFRRYELQRNPEDLSGAIANLKKALQEDTINIPDTIDIQNTLSNYLGIRYENYGESCDLQDAIFFSREALQSLTSNHPYSNIVLNNLSVLLRLQFHHTNTVMYLDEAIDVIRQGIEYNLQKSDALAERLSNLSDYLYCRYQRSGRIEDLHESISKIQDAIQMVQNNTPSRGTMLNNLGNYLDTRYERNENIKDIEESIDSVRSALSMITESHINWCDWTDNLANHLGHLYELTGDISSLDEAIEKNKETVKKTARSNVRFARRLNNLGNLLELSYRSTFRVTTLAESINAARDAVKATPNDSPDLANRLRNLGNKIKLRFEQGGKSQDFDESRAIFSNVFCSHSASPLIRVRSARQLLSLLITDRNWVDGSDIAQKAIELLPLVNSRSLAHDDKQFLLTEFSGLAAEACSVMFEANLCLFDIIQVLEMGRGAILGHLIDSRGNIDLLRKTCSSCADAFEQLMQDINLNISPDINQHARAELLERKIHADKELESCLKKIRAHPELARFLRGPTRSELLDLASEGAIVIVNVTKIRSDAIIIQEEEISHLPLPGLKYPDIQLSVMEETVGQTTPEEQSRQNSGLRDYLSLIWTNCVKPVCDVLGFVDAVQPRSRTWWIGSGAASSIPFHAAGLFQRDGFNSTFSRTILSYIPTIKVLQHSRERIARAQKFPNLRYEGENQQGTIASSSYALSRPKVLVISMPTTPGSFPPLENVVKEIALLKSSVEGKVFVEVLPQPSALEVLSRLDSADIAHFACHGQLDTKNPSESFVALQRKSSCGENQLDMLTVKQVAERAVQRSQIAYLSACLTAANISGKMIDEVLHLTSAFQVAGFCHVIGSIFPVFDFISVEVAAGFYDRIAKHISSEGSIEGKTVALALSQAVQDVRSRYPRMPLYWAPYIHSGP